MIRMPQTVLGRAGIVLLGALLALVIIGYWAFRQGIEDVAISLRERTLAERLVSIQRTIQSIESEEDRDRTAHGLSSTSLTGARSALFWAMPVRPLNPQL